jgi:hypothetical protein
VDHFKEGHLPKLDSVNQMELEANEKESGSESRISCVR